MAIASYQITVIHPAAEDQAVQYELAARLSTLEGKRVGLIDNRKRNSDVFLLKLQDLLRDKYGVADFQYYRKDSASIPTPPEVMADLVNTCDAVLHGVAD